MRTPLKRLFSSLFCVVMAFSGIYTSASTDCELLLQSAFAKVTEKALLSRNISIDDLNALVHSDVPFNPLKNQTRTSSNSSLSAAFDALTARCAQDGNWEAVRAELKVLAVRNGAEQVETDSARKATAKVLAPRLEVTQSGMILENAKWFCTSKGRCLFLFTNSTTGKAEIRDVNSTQPIWQEQVAHEDITGAYPWNFAENESGDPLLLFARPEVKSGLERVRYFWAEKYLLTSVNLNSGERNTRAIFNRGVPYLNKVFAGSRGPVILGNTYGRLAEVKGPLLKFSSGEKSWSETLAGTSKSPVFVRSYEYDTKIDLMQFRNGVFEEITGKPIVRMNTPSKAHALIATRDGQFAFAYAGGAKPSQDAVTYNPPFVAEQSAGIQLEGSEGRAGNIQVVEMDGQIFVVVEREPKGQSIDVFEPAVSEKALATIKPGDSASGYPPAMKAFAHDGRLFVVTGFPGESLDIYEPLVSATARVATMSMSVNDRFLGIKTDESGQVYVLVSGKDLNTRVYSLFHDTEGR